MLHERLPQIVCLITQRGIRRPCFDVRRQPLRTKVQSLRSWMQREATLCYCSQSPHSEERQYQLRRHPWTFVISVSGTSEDGLKLKGHSNDLATRPFVLAEPVQTRLVMVARLVLSHAKMTLVLKLPGRAVVSSMWAELQTVMRRQAFVTTRGGTID